MAGRVKLVAKRLGQTVVTVFGLAIINFCVLSLAPGDVIDALVAAGGASDAGYADALRKAFGLDQTWIGRLFDYLVGVATLNFGYSISLSMPVMQAIKAKRTGMAKGFPDTQCLAGGRLCAFIEFKAKSGSLDDEQINWLNWLHGCGFPVAVCRHPDTAAEFLRSHGFPFMGRIAA